MRTSLVALQMPQNVGTHFIRGEGFGDVNPSAVKFGSLRGQVVCRRC